ncbi:MAG: hypothetical protein D6806_01965 [Deltaproteobacteria bacterium]|nr:MAG: hypothetical protein D6806_01965 [Deltaproteobacteria bacterium]
MNDKAKIVTGVIIFLVAFSFPWWYQLAAGKAGALELEKPAGRKLCIEDTGYMKSRHMELLDQWRDLVVRGGDGVYVPLLKHPCGGDSDCPGGACVQGNCRYDMSLTGTCLACHRRSRFCNRCHEHLNVRPYCWDCHLSPEKE